MEQVPAGSQESGDPLLGQIIDEKYRIDEVLGRGGMGVVYKATHTLMKRTVAVKMLHRRLLDDFGEQEFVERFRREAQTHASFEHPHAVTIHEYGIHQGSPFLVMQYVEGRTLKDLLEQERPLPRSRALPFIIQVAEALHEAHQVGVVHRDLKPDNIMIAATRDGREKAVLLDFGIAKVLERDVASPELTQEGQVTGTPQYMSPEQIRGNSLDERSDIYAMGVILYEICAGRRPFDADTAVALMMNHMSEAPIPLREQAPGLDIPPALEKVVMKALEKDPEARQQNLSELVDELVAAVPEECRFDRSAFGDGRRKLPKSTIALLSLLIAAMSGLLVYQYAARETAAVQNKAPDWSIIRAGLDDAVEKVNEISELAGKTAGYSRKVANTRSPSERERWEMFKERAIAETREMVSAYRRELVSLHALAGTEAIAAKRNDYLEAKLNTEANMPNRSKIVERIIAHISAVEKNAALSDDMLIYESIRAADPDALEMYRGYFTDFCTTCERG